MKLALFCKSIISVALLLFISCGSKETATTNTSIGSALEGLLPANSELSGFTQTDAPSSFNRDKAWDHLGKEADKFLYNGFQECAKAKYKASEGKRSFTLELMRFENPVRAFAIYTFLRTPFAKPVALDPLGYVGGDTLVFVRGAYVGRAIGASSGMENDLTAAAKAMMSKLSDSVKLPAQVLLFPKEGTIPNTETVTLDDIEGQTWDSNLFGRKYLIGNDTVQIYVRLETVDGPTVAVKRFIGDKGRIQSYILDSGCQAMTATNERGQLVFCGVDKGVLCTVVGNVDQKTAQDLVNQVYATASQLGLK